MVITVVFLTKQICWWRGWFTHGDRLAHNGWAKKGYQLGVPGSQDKKQNIATTCHFRLHQITSTLIKNYIFQTNFVISSRVSVAGTLKVSVGALCFISIHLCNTRWWSAAVSLKKKKKIYYPCLFHNLRMTLCASDLVAMKWALLISCDTGLFCFCWLRDMSALDTGALIKNNNNNNIAVFFSFFFWHECKLKSAILPAPAKSISELYNRLPRANDENTLYIKGKWGMDAWIGSSEEAWAVIGASSGPPPIPWLARRLLEAYY